MESLGRVALRAGSILSLITLVEGDTPRKESNDDGYTFYHYTDQVGLAGIMATHKILPNNKGKVYLTNIAMAPSEAFQNLFNGQATHANRGDDVVVFRLNSYQVAHLETNGREYLEFVYPKGTLKLEKVIYGGPNLTKQKK
ncbi:hypothetical protein GVN16_10470 [Emticicia sp. CRIBPO]|uniref:hypothetical protein n=1 Tax=Emticicia sp. CRIBPO TaxID=2683258 RepID=UPI0014134217|nr:hypothetical protein [Emticicia sp. CRIBPO]NBA86187.1 hypothetical protein [Emticicia sp. CRIBPO]